ncbi:MAG TPA: YaiI/YqxD family protein [Caldithrix sp.]|nr:YaiI/YqxD family protein [Calditrichaceae bacterium]HEM49242.1 YaiI/YqxD family protein [Caldithrix sp.]
MKIWVDADACPKPIKNILFRVADRLKIFISFISNQRITIPKSQFINTVQVSGGFDIADEYIIEHLKPLDLVITADIPLAATIVEKNGFALNPRGTLYDRDNIPEILTMRNLKDELRSAGMEIRGPSQFRPGDTEAFANQLDTFLNRIKNDKGK